MGLLRNTDVHRRLLIDLQDVTTVPPRRAVLVAVLALAVVAVALIVLQPTSPGSGWMMRTVQVPLSANTTTRPCFWVNSSLYLDRFCMTILPTPGGAILNGTLDHGPSTSPMGFQLTNSALCHAGCPTNAMWTSPDGTGRVSWNLSSFAILIEARN